jgi:hypothetical protein
MSIADEAARATGFGENGRHQQALVDAGLDRVHPARNGAITAQASDEQNTTVEVGRLLRAQGIFIGEQQKFITTGDIPAYSAAQEKFLEQQGMVLREIDPKRYSQALGEFIATQGYILHDLGVL